MPQESLVCRSRFLSGKHPEYRPDSKYYSTPYYFLYYVQVIDERVTNLEKQINEMNQKIQDSESVIHRTLEEKKTRQERVNDMQVLLENVIRF